MSTAYSIHKATGGWFVAENYRMVGLTSVEEHRVSPFYATARIALDAYHTLRAEEA